MEQCFKGGVRLKKLKDKKGEGYIDVCVFILCMLLILAFIFSVLPVFIAKHQLDIFVTELCREAEIVGEIGSETSAKEEQLKSQLNIEPQVEWSKTGKIQLNEEIEVVATIEKELGNFGGLNSFKVPIRAKASGKSEVYHK